MPQDRKTGAKANQFGRDMARKVAKAMGAELIRKGSNEAEYKGKRVVIKCANARTDSLGVSYKMIKRLDSVIGAFVQEDGRHVDLVSVAASIVKDNMAPTKSKGASAGKVGIVKNRVVHDKGRKIGTIIVGV
jgi:hypothetical protein